MSDNTRNQALLILVVLFTLGAVATLLPLSAPKPNDLGYMSLCPFAPWSTLTLLLIAGALWALRKYLLTSNR